MRVRDRVHEPGMRPDVFPWPHGGGNPSQTHTVSLVKAPCVQPRHVDDVSPHGHDLLQDEYESAERW